MDGDVGDVSARRTRAEFGVALLLELLGSGVAAILSAQTWQVITTHRPAPQPDDVLHVSGRLVDAAPLAFALVALAGVVAVLATRGVVRRIVGGVVVLAGLGLIWRSAGSFGAVTAARARTLVENGHRAVSVTGGASQTIATQPVWPVLSVVCGVLVLVGGGLVAAHGHRWRAMSARYEASTPATVDPARAAATMWSALDRGEDPTSRN